MEGVPELVFDPGDGDEPVRSIRARLRRQPFGHTPEGTEEGEGGIAGEGLCSRCSSDHSHVDPAPFPMDGTSR